jgi:hypothetical protein
LMNSRRDAKWLICMSLCNMQEILYLDCKYVFRDPGMHVGTCTCMRVCVCPNFYLKLRFRVWTLLGLISRTSPYFWTQK